MVALILILILILVLIFRPHGLSGGREIPWPGRRRARSATPHQVSEDEHRVPVG
jgi:hypothetical protein